jgi:hypothetical protein
MVLCTCSRPRRWSRASKHKEDGLVYLFQSCVYEGFSASNEVLKEGEPELRSE